MRNNFPIAIAMIFFAAAPFGMAGEIQFKLDEEIVQFQADDREWRIVLEQGADDKGVVEYVAADENKEVWTERVTINYFKGMQGNDLATRLTNFAKKGLERQCADVDWESISAAPKDALYRWSAKNCVGAPDQSEMARAFIGKRAFYVIHYANKKVPMPPDKFSIWKKNLENASLT